MNTPDAAGRPAPTTKRVTVAEIARMRAEGERIAMLTCYDYPTARVLDEAGIPILLVGDSLGMVVLGYDTTVRVSMEEMLHHTRAVARGTRRALVVADMPFLSYGVSAEASLANAGRFLSDAGAGAVKVEGGERTARTIEALTRIGIPVMAHIGLTPQAVHQLGGYRVQGRTRQSARALLNDALAVQQAGAFAVVLELVPAQLAAAITERLTIPTIGIGAGAGCSGQVQVVTDLLGLTADRTPRHARVYADLRGEIRRAAERYQADVASGAFPAEAESWRMEDELLAEVLGRSELDRTPAEGIPLDRDL